MVGSDAWVNWATTLLSPSPTTIDSDLLNVRRALYGVMGTAPLVGRQPARLRLAYLASLTSVNRPRLMGAGSGHNGSPGSWYLARAVSVRTQRADSALWQSNSLKFGTNSSFLDKNVLNPYAPYAFDAFWLCARAISACLVRVLAPSRSSSDSARLAER